MNEILILIGTLGGAIVGAIAGFIGAWIREKHETKRRMRELVIKTAIDEWTQLFNFTQSQTKKTELFPLTAYIAHHTLLIEAVLNEKFDIEKFKKAIEQSNEVMTEIYKNDKKEREALKEIKNVPDLRV